LPRHNENELIEDLNSQYDLSKELATIKLEPSKSTTKAVVFRKAGNAEFMESRFNKAIELYTKSVATNVGLMTVEVQP